MKKLTYAIIISFGLSFLIAQDNSPQISLVDINNKTFTGQGFIIDEKGKCTLIEPGNQKRTLDLSDILEITFNTPPLQEKPHWEITFSNNDLVYGKIGEAAGDGFQFESSITGRIEVRFEHLSMVRSMINPGVGGNICPQPAEDTVYLANGDNDKGVVLAFSKDGLKLQSSIYSKERSYDLKEISAIAFCRVKSPPKPAEKLTAVLIGQDRTRLTGEIKKTADGYLYFDSVYHQPYQISLSRIAQIYFKTDRCVYLSDLEPISVKEYPTLPGLFLWKYQKDKNVTSGHLISFKGKTYYKGLGVHANCELTYKLDGQYTRFFAVVGLDDEAGPPQGNVGAGSRASVQFLVWLDNKKAYETNIIKWGDDPQEIALSVKGVKEMRLVVTDGGDMHILDRAAWAAARLIK